VRALQPKNPRATLAISGGIDRPPAQGGDFDVFVDGANRRPDRPPRR